jgi:hypothetical protein
MKNGFPRMMVVRQKFPPTPAINVRAALEAEFTAIRSRISRGQKIAVATGSRGITHIGEILTTLIRLIKDAGADPFIIPAMGSHGGATAEGQTEVLSEYGITEKNFDAPIRASMEVQRIGQTPDGAEVFVTVEALRADGVIVVNRIKPHTDFVSDTLGSGLQKIMVVGLGKRVGAANYHASSSRFGYEHVLKTSARVILDHAPILGGVGIVENHVHETAHIQILPREEIPSGEEKLFRLAKSLMPKLPFDDIDLLIIDRIGKNISGSGMDPNITGRGVHGYFSELGDKSRRPMVRRLFVRELTPETRGNGIGIGMADFTTTRLVKELDLKVIAINSLTSLTPNGAKIPIHFDTDREVLENALASLALAEIQRAKIVRIADTLSLETTAVSEAYAEMVRQRNDLETVTPAAAFAFNSDGNLGEI